MMRSAFGRPIVQVKNPAGEDTREGVTVSSREEVELSGSRGTAHFALKWARDARQQANLQVVEDIKGVTLEWSGAPFSYLRWGRGTVTINEELT